MEFSNIISEIGFPIAVCVALFWNNRDVIKRYEKLIDSFRMALEENTKVLNTLVKERGENV